MKLLYPVNPQIWYRSAVQMAEEGSGEVSLNAPVNLAVGLTFSPASISVDPGFGMVNHADHGNNVQGTVEAPVSSAVEPVPGGVA